MTSRFRRWDVAVAAGLLIVISGVAVPVFSHWQARARLTECQNNLRLFSHALMTYADQNAGFFPRVEDEPPRNAAGWFVPILYQAGVLDPTVRWTCPADPRVEQHHAKDAPVPTGYAYTLGYRDQEGKLIGLRYDPGRSENGYLPILADGPKLLPNHEVASGRFHAHGQNVLYLSGQVRFCTDLHVGVDGDHIYLNLHNVVRAGLNRYDTVLGTGGDEP